MREEFHGNGEIESAFVGKLLYGWNSLNTNVWLPSFIELVGYNPNQYYEPTGTYLPAMQGLNMSGKWYWIDEKGGTQFAFFAQYNANGGGEKLWVCGGQAQFWLRSNIYSSTTSAWKLSNTTVFDGAIATTTLAVHPAVSSMQVAYRSLFSKGREKLLSYAVSPFSHKAAWRRGDDNKNPPVQPCVPKHKSQRHIAAGFCALIWDYARKVAPIASNAFTTFCIAVSDS